MLVRMGLLNKKPDWTMERFRAHWRDQHGPLAARLPGLRTYVQNHVVDSAQRGIQFVRGPEQLDGISQLSFEDEAAMQHAMQSEVAPRLVEDENHFIGRLRIISVQPHEVVAPPLPGMALKRMSLLRRKHGMSAERFAHEWQAVHGPLVLRMPGVLGYRQNLIVGRQEPKGVTVDYDAMPIDGVVELWFESLDAIDQAFGSPKGRETMAHAQTFIEEITTFLVEPHEVL